MVFSILVLITFSAMSFLILVNYLQNLELINDQSDLFESQDRDDLIRYCFISLPRRKTEPKTAMDLVCSAYVKFKSRQG